MDCALNFCVYWSRERCQREKISVDINGCCESYIPVHIKAADLDAARKAARERLCVDKFLKK